MKLPSLPLFFMSLPGLVLGLNACSGGQSTPYYSVGGSVSGLGSGKRVVLQLDNGNAAAA